MFDKNERKESIDRISASKKGRPGTFSGKTHREESKQKVSKTRIERGSGVGEKNGRFKGYAVCVSGDYVGQKKTATEWGKIFKMDSSGFRLHLYGTRYKNGFDGNFFKWEHDVVL